MELSQLLKKLEKILLNEKIKIQEKENLIFQLYSNQQSKISKKKIIENLNYREFNFTKIKMHILEGEIKNAINLLEIEMQWALRKNYLSYFKKNLIEFKGLASNKLKIALYSLPENLINKNIEEIKKNLKLIKNYEIDEESKKIIKIIVEFVNKRTQEPEDKIVLGFLNYRIEKMNITVLESIIYSIGVNEFEKLYSDIKKTKMSSIIISDDEILKLELAPFLNKKKETKERRNHKTIESKKNIYIKNDQIKIDEFNEIDFNKVNMQNIDQHETEILLAKLYNIEKYKEVLILLDECSAELRKKYRDLIWECKERLNEKN